MLYTVNCTELRTEIKVLCSCVERGDYSTGDLNFVSLVVQGEHDCVCISVARAQQTLVLVHISSVVDGVWIYQCC